MPAIVPVIISLVISIAALNLGGHFGFWKSGKVLGASEANPDISNVLEPLSKKADVMAAAVNDRLERISSMRTKEPSRNTLPSNGESLHAPEPVKIGSAGDLEVPCDKSVVVDLKSAKLLYAKNAEVKSSIASISKLMTALVFLEHNPGWENVYEMKEEDRREGGLIYLLTGEKVKVRDLFYSSLVASDNTATIALVRSTGMTEADFVSAMNKKASDLGLKDTYFKDPVGLVDDNVSTAVEVAKFAQAALSNEEIKKATLTRNYEFTTIEGVKKSIRNTDNLLSVFLKNGVKLKGGKTGYTEAAGYCFVAAFTNEDGNDVVSVVLGSETKESRFSDTHNLIDWIYKAYGWK